MKISLILLTGILLCTQLFAQSKFFIPFGQPAEKVMASLNERSYVLSLHQNVEMRTLSAEVEEGKQVEYAFDINNTHYATTVSRTYNTRRESLKFRQSCQKYMKMVSRDQVEVVNYGDIVCHTAITANSIIKLFVISHGAAETLQMTTISRTIGPGKDDALFHYEENILNQPIAKN